MTEEKLNYIKTRTHCMDLKDEDKVVQSLDLSGTIIDVSPGWLKMTGYERSEVIGKHFVQFLNLDSLFTVEDNFPKLKNFGFVNHIPLNIVCKNKDILKVELNGTSKYSDNGKFEKTFCEITPLKDIT